MELLQVLKSTDNRRRKMRSIARAAVAAGAAVVGVSLVPSVAWAATGGYGSSGTSSTPTAPGGFTSVVASQIVGSGGATVSGAVGSAEVSVDVPSGTFSTPVDVTLTAPSDLSAIPNAIAAFAVSIASNGTPVSGTFSPITVTVKDSSIAVGDTVDYWNGTSFVPYSNASVSAGEVTITVTSDPTFALMPPASTSGTVPQATTPHTGIPVDGIALAVAAALASGGVLLLALRRS